MATSMISNRLPQWHEFKILQKIGPKTGGRMKALVAERQKLVGQQKAAETRIKEINEEIGPAMEASGVAAVECDGWRVTLKSGRGPSRISAEKLVDHGIDPAVVVACTVPGKEYKAVEVRKLKGQGVDDGEET